MRLLKITLILIVTFAAVWLSLPAPSSATPDRDTGLSPDLLVKLHPALAKQLLSEPDAAVRVQIVMRDQALPQTLTKLNRATVIADLQSAGRSIASRRARPAGSAERARRASVVDQ